MRRVLLAALVGLLPMAALADTTITGPITFSTGLHVVGSKVTLDTPTLTTLGGIKSHAAVTHQFLTGLSTAGVLSGAQPSCADLSDAGSGCTGSGGSPASPVNSLQKNATGNFGAAAVSDDGATLTATEPTLINIPGTLGSELLSNPGFVANDTGWTLGDCSTWSAGQFTTTYTACSDPVVSTTFSSVVGHYYRVTVAFSITGDQNYIWFDNTRGSSGPSSGPTQTYTFQATYTGVDTVHFDLWNYNADATRTITSASIKEVTIAGAPFTVQTPDGYQPIQVDALGNVVVAVNQNGGDGANFKLSGAPNNDPSIGAAVWENRGVLMLSGFATPWLSSGDIPSADLLGGTGSAFTSVSVGSGLSLSAGVLSASGGPSFTDPGTYPAFAFWSGANAINGGWSITAPSNKRLDFITVNNNPLNIEASDVLYLHSDSSYIDLAGNNGMSGKLGQFGAITLNAGHTQFDVGAEVQINAGDGNASAKQGGQAQLRAGNANGAGNAAGGAAILQAGAGHGSGLGGDVHLTTGASGGGGGRSGVVFLDGVAPPSSCAGLTGGAISQQTVGGVGNVLVLCP